MLPRFTRTTTFRIAALYVAVFGASVLLLLGYIHWATAGYMARQVDATIEAEVEGLAEQYRQRGLTGLARLIDERATRDRSGESLYLLADSDYRRVAGNLDGWPRAAGETGWVEFEVGGRPARAYRFLLRGRIRLLVGRDVAELDAVRGLIVSALGWGLAMTVGLALAGAATLSRTTLRRIESMDATRREIMSGDLSRRIPTRGTDDELDRLADGLNRMLDQIEGLMDGVRQVSDNVAHDLRTPLTRLRNRLERLRVGALEGPERDALVEESLLEADRLLATFHALLRIARLEAGGVAPKRAPVDLGEVVRDAAELYEPLVQERGQELRVEWEPGVVVRGDRDLLFQAITNLLDNAHRHTPPGGAIGVRLSVPDGGPVVVVVDAGSGIPEERREEVFDRFTRLEASRSTEGHGLGLSLVRAVAEHVGARVVLADARPGADPPGLRAEIRFPPG